MKQSLTVISVFTALNLMVGSVALAGSETQKKASISAGVGSGIASALLFHRAAKDSKEIRRIRPQVGKITEVHFDGLTDNRNYSSNVVAAESKRAIQTFEPGSRIQIVGTRYHYVDLPAGYRDLSAYSPVRTIKVPPGLSRVNSKYGQQWIAKRIAETKKGFEYKTMVPDAFDKMKAQEPLAWDVYKETRHNGRISGFTVLNGEVDYVKKAQLRDLKLGRGMRRFLGAAAGALSLVSFADAAGYSVIDAIQSEKKSKALSNSGSNDFAAEEPKSKSGSTN